MVSQASQMPPETEFATKADMENVVQTLTDAFRSEIAEAESRIQAEFTAALEASEQRVRADFATTLEESEQRVRTDFVVALEAAEKRIRADFKSELKDTESRLTLEIANAKISTLRWGYGTVVAMAATMTACITAAVIALSG